jgi:hypothetical protein
MRFLLSLLLTATLAATMPAAHADTLFDNLGARRDGADPLLSYGPLADSFSTGAQANLVLTQVTALLKSDSAGVVGDLRINLRADGASGPGVLLATLATLSSAAVSTQDFAAYTFTPSSGIQLAAGTTYWIQIEAASPNAIEWSWSGDLSGTGVAAGANYNALFGANPNAALAPYQMSVTVQAVPEPASLALMLGGVGVLVAARTARSKR